MSDPLKVLHEYAIGRRPFEERKQGNDVYFCFGDIAYPKDVRTNLSVYGKTSEYYMLESLKLLWDNNEMAHTAYVKLAATKNIQPVTRPDRRELIAYLKGEREAPPTNVDYMAPIPTAIPVSRLVLDQADGGPEAKRPKYSTDEPSILENKQRIGQLLEGDQAEGEDEAASIANLRGLNQELTAERIAMLKMKAKKRKRVTIKTMEVGSPSAMDIEMADAAAADAAGDWKSRERIWRTRTTCLEARSKDFYKPIAAILQAQKASEDAASRSKQPVGTSGGLYPPLPKTAPMPTQASATNNKQRAVQQVGYSRYDQEQFRREETAGFQIDTGFSMRGQILAMNAGGDARKALASGNTNDFSSRIMPQQSTMMNNANNPANMAQNQLGPDGKPRRISRTPIIIIPAAGTSLITMYNAKDILQNLRYVTTDELKATGTRREAEILLQRRRDAGVTVPYRVVDNALKLNGDEWERVVAVFVQGPAWQFKGWRWNGNPTEIFSRVAAFHITYDEQKLDPNVAKWNVNVLSLSRTKRHLDRAILAKFWTMLDKHIIKHKPHLRY